MNIYLIGLPGSGKSTFGEKFATYIHYNFIDLDVQISKQEKKSITEIFDEKGEDYFRTKESEYLKCTEHLTTTIIACGGGTPCFHNNLEWINNQGISVYLNTPIVTILSRISNDFTRPLLISNKEKVLTSLLEKRKIFYEKAQFTISGIEPLDELKKLIVG